MRILVTGGTGLVGRAIGRRLARAHQLIVLSRDGKAAKSRISYPAELVAWDSQSELSPKILEGVDAIIHLAGENISSGRWTEDRKKSLRDSRIQPLHYLRQVMEKNGRQVKILLSASAVGFYGDRGDEWLNEDSAAGSDFLATLVKDWESAAQSVPARRTAFLRFGVILSPEGGFLTEVQKMFRRLGASRLGSGQQYLSWIHIDDVVDVIAQALVNPAYSGPVNLVSPAPITNREMTDILKKLGGYRSLPPAPAMALKLLYGEMSQVLLSSQRVRPGKLLDARHAFKFQDFQDACRPLISR